jgi:hypothetical protein
MVPGLGIVYNAVRNFNQPISVLGYVGTMRNNDDGTPFGGRSPQLAKYQFLARRVEVACGFIS